ncbi:MAG: glycosyltransferase [Akkermansiaceae bacterium]
MLFLFWRLKNTFSESNSKAEKAYAVDEDSAPKVLTQIPLYNESTVAERIIRAVAAIDYPNHEIQVLDDSNDETREIVDKVVTEYQSQGLNIETVRRDDRSGFKAGALAYGMTLSDAPYIAIFDADFVPPVDFLRRTIPHFSNQEKCAVVQARWTHLNAEDSALTKAQSVGIDGHFVVEQTARSYNDYFLNFNGTAGVWNREAIDDAGGWQADTLTEDLDLSYRAQLRGWKFHFLPDLCVPAELPGEFRSFRSQQFRWAKGSIQTSLKLLPRIWKSTIPLRKKVESTFHLTHYGLHFFMFLQAVLALPIALVNPMPFDTSVFIWFLIPMGFAMMGPSLLYLYAELWICKTRWLHFLRRLPMLLLIGFGVCASNARACLEGLLGIESAFIRTPKKGDKKEKVRYKSKRSFMPLIEIGVALLTFSAAIAYVYMEIYGAAPFFLIYTLGLGTMGIKSWVES